jgi:hypothetical protein
MHPEVQEGIQRQWQAQMQGPGNWHHTPLIFTKDGQGAAFVKFRDSNKDMEFHQLLAFMITVLCACYNIHPEEIGMQSWAPVQATLNQPSPQARIEASRTRGLKPLLRLVANLINHKIIWQMFPDRKYIFRWVNIDPADEERELELRRMRLEMGLTLPSQEIADADREKHPFAHIPGNAYMFQAWQMQEQAKQQEKMQAEQPEVERGQEQEPEWWHGLQQKDQQRPPKDEEEESREPARKSLAEPEKVIEVTIND